MFIGHYAPAFVAAALPRASRLGPLFVAAQLVDLAFFGLVLGGVERMREVPGHTVMNTGDFYYMPWTHSLIGTLGFAAAFAIAVRLYGGGWFAAWTGAAVVASHWLLDWVAHAPDLTIAGVGPRYGLGLWNRPEIEMPLELALVTLAIIFYASRTRARSAGGNVALGLLCGVMLALQFADWLGPKTATVLDPVPASFPLTAIGAYAVMTALAWSTAHTRVAEAGPGGALA